MIKNTLFIIALIISTTIINSQNSLKSLYNLDSFPDEMEKSKKFINEMSDGIFMYNFISGGNGSYQFDQKSENDLHLNLPLKDKFLLHFFDIKTKKAATNVSFYITYAFNYLNYFDEFELTDDTFSLHSLFDLAIKHYDYDEYRLVNKLLRDYMPDLNHETKRILFFEEVSKGLNLEEIPNFKELVSKEEQQKLTYSDVEEVMLDEILEEVDYEDIIKYLFNHYILDETNDDKTKKNINQLFNDENAIEKVEKNILQPTIQIGFSKQAFLSIPKEIIDITNTTHQSFPVRQIEIHVDFKNKSLYIDFNSKSSIDVKINKAVQAEKEVENVTVKSQKLRLIISESKTICQLFESKLGRHIETLPFEIYLKN
ncbi:hypothetical protein [uncultured Kordia sp.]|uniref:hypothetical protein n=1 Tax=uncultured Kordia sp. TaxID=507699 RepID=UPI00261A2986|nr:hypothetical protein [uncultured Kordia sp.]